MNFGVQNVVDSKVYLLLECLVLHIYRCVKSIGTVNNIMLYFFL